MSKFVILKPTTNTVQRKLYQQRCLAKKGNNENYENYDDTFHTTDKSYLLFQTKSQEIKDNPISLYDVRDAIECCSIIKNDQMRYDCYHQFGVDGRMAEKYFKHVEKMERQYEKVDEEMKKKKQNDTNVHPKIYKNNKKALRKWFHFNIFNDE